LHFSRKCALRKRLDDKFFNEINDLEAISDVIHQRNSFQIKDLAMVVNVLLEIFEICNKNKGHLQRSIGGSLVQGKFVLATLKQLVKITSSCV
jgi:hypothetical protein